MSSRQRVIKDALQSIWPEQFSDEVKTAAGLIWVDLVSEVAVNALDGKFK